MVAAGEPPVSQRRQWSDSCYRARSRSWQLSGPFCGATRRPEKPRGLQSRRYETAWFIGNPQKMAPPEQRALATLHKQRVDNNLRGSGPERVALARCRLDRWQQGPAKSHSISPGTCSGTVSEDFLPLLLDIPDFGCLSIVVSSLHARVCSTHHGQRRP